MKSFLCNRSALFLGSFWTFLGGLIRALSSFPGLGDLIDVEAQYWICIVGQALTGMGNPVAVSVPTKVSQHWFKEKERTFATIALAMSLPLGIVFGQGITPLFVKDTTDIPTMNWVWFIPSALTMILCSVAVRSSKPPTPPSRSAEVKQEVLPYMTRMKLLLTNRNYLAINLAIGGAVGFFNCLATQLQQILCSRGYNNEYSGLVGSLLLGAGFLGSIFTGLIVQKTGQMEEVAKICFCIASLDSILVSEFMRKADQSVMIALCCAIFGIFGFGMYPIGLELSVENTYPVDEAAGTALIFLSGQIQGSILIMISGAMEQELSPELVENSVSPTIKAIFINFLLLLFSYLSFNLGMSRRRERSH